MKITTILHDCRVCAGGGGGETGADGACMMTTTMRVMIRRILDMAMHI